MGCKCSVDLWPRANPRARWARAGTCRVAARNMRPVPLFTRVATEADGFWEMPGWIPEQAPVAAVYEGRRVLGATFGI